MNDTKTELSIEQYILEYAKKIEERMQEHPPKSWDFPDELRKSMQYSLMAGGKRLRPILAIAATEAVGGDVKDVLDLACALEFVHTYSLIHDDLPGMDNDDYRRGKLTNHKVFSEATAILAGDALLTHAFYLIAQLSHTSSLSANILLKLVEELSYYAGARGMVGGQMADMIGEQGNTKLEELNYIHERKTGDLIVFSLRAGGYAASASATQLHILTDFGRKLGFAFQIQDDILDVVGDEAKLGKRVNSDLTQEKVTYPYLIGLEACQEQVAQLTSEAKSLILNSDLPNKTRLLQLADFLMKRDH